MNAPIEAGSVLLASARAPERRLLFERPSHIIAAMQPDDVLPALHAIDDAVRDGFHLAGFISYEAGFALEPSLRDLARPLPDGTPLLWFGCYREPATPTAPDAPAQAAAIEPTLSLTPQEYTQKVEAIREFIAAGETYQANLTLQATWPNSERPEELFERLLRAQPTPYAALLRPTPELHLLSLSPELFFTRRGLQIRTEPMKGTASPGRSVAETESQASWLAHDEKNRAENLMIVDLLRNDLGRICEIGSVHATNLFDVQRYPSVLQMTSTVTGTLRSGIGFAEIVRALFPSGSIVGAPKIHTMRRLRQLETQPRGVYTGAIGHIAPTGEAEFNVAIRTLTLRENRAVMGVGSGIVYDSVAEDELRECHTKLNFLTRQSPQFSLIETLLLERGTYVLLDRHMARLARSAEHFGIAIDLAQIRAVLAEAQHAWLHHPCVRVRLLVDQNGGASWSATELAVDDTEPTAVMLHRERTDPADPFFCHKTTHRALYDAALREAQQRGCADALFTNIRGELTEGAIHNLILELDGAWFTPPLGSGVLPGVFREDLIERGRIHERVLQREDLANASAIFLCNSVRGLRRVERIDEG